MIPTDPILRFKMIERMLSSCMNNLDSFTTWEEGFIESASIQFEDRKSLTDRQCEILEKIYDKIQ